MRSALRASIVALFKSLRCQASNTFFASLISVQVATDQCCFAIGGCHLSIAYFGDLPGTLACSVKIVINLLRMALCTPCAGLLFAKVCLYISIVPNSILSWKTILGKERFLFHPFNVIR